VKLLKERIAMNNPPHLFKCLQLPLPSFTDMITDENLRCRIRERHKRLIQQSKSNMMSLYIAVAEAQMRQTKIKFDRHMDKIWQNKKNTSEDNRLLSNVLINLIDRRLTNLTKRMDCVTNFKVNFFVQAPTVINNATM
jgi:hypothetical protein